MKRFGILLALLPILVIMIPRFGAVPGLF